MRRAATGRRAFQRTQHLGSILKAAAVCHRIHQQTGVGPLNLEQGTTSTLKTAKKLSKLFRHYNSMLDDGSRHVKVSESISICVT